MKNETPDFRSLSHAVKIIETPDFTLAKYVRNYKGHEIYKDTMNYWRVHKNTGVINLVYWTFEDGKMKLNVVM